MSRKPSLPDPTAVVAGKARASIEQLFALIAEVNPTDRGLPARQQTERYALKAKLQGLLIRQHPEMIEVVAEGTHGVVSLRHRIAGRDACHAMIASLDDAARRWVETELALGRAPAPQVASARAPTEARAATREAPLDALGRGLLAVEEYDFETARELLSAAFQESRGAPAAARALLDLLVHQLADDLAALALEVKLSPTAAVDPEVRTALALAAAREGDAASALRWLRGLDGASVGDTLVVLAESAIRIGDADCARDHAAAVRTTDPTHPALGRLATEVERLRSAARAPLERALAAVLDSGEWPAVGAQAALILARWPESEAARDALRRREIARQRELAAGLAHRARAALGAGDFAAALRLVREARAVNAADDAIIASLDEIELETKRSAELATLAAVRAGFASGAIPRALRGWLALGDTARAEIRASADRTELRWLTEMGRALGTVEAVLAMNRAEAALSDDDADTAIAAMEPHLRAIRATADGRALVSLAEGLRTERTRGAATADVAAANAALASGDLDAAEAAARRLAGTGDAAVVRERITTERARRVRVAELARATKNGDFDLAASMAMEFEVSFEEALRAKLHDRIRPRRFDDVEGTLRAFLLDNDSSPPRTWLSPAGDRVVLVRGFANRLVAWVCDAETLTPAFAWTWRLPRPMQVCSWVVEEDTVTVVGKEIALFRASLLDGRPLRWRAPAAQPGDRVDVATLAAGGRHLWVARIVQQMHIETRVYEVDRWPSWQAAGPSGIPQPLWGAEPALVALGGIGKGVTLHHPNGRRVHASKSWLPQHRATRVAVNAAGEPLLALVDLSEAAESFRSQQAPEHQQAVSPDPVGVAYMTASRSDGHIARYAASNIHRPHMLAPARAEARTYALVTSGTVSAVMWFEGEPRTGGNREGGIRYVPANAVLIHDITGTRTRVLVYTSTAVRVLHPEDGAPEVSGPLGREHLECTLAMQGMDIELACGRGPTDGDPNHAALVSSLRSMSLAERESWIGAYRANHMADIDGQFRLANAMAELGRVDDGIERLNELVNLAPDHPQSRYAQAWSDLSLGEWEKVWTHLDGIDTSKFPPAQAQHALHMLGLAGLRTGRWNQGTHLIREASWVKGGECNLEGIIGVIDTLRGDPVPDEPTDSRGWIMHRTGKLIRSIVAADEHLAVGDAAGAIADLDHATVWRAEDAQSAARLADAWLASGAGGFAKWLGVAGLLGAQHSLRLKQGHDVPLGDRSWAPQRLDEVEARAVDWLDREGGDA